MLLKNKTQTKQIYENLEITNLLFERVKNSSVYKLTSSTSIRRHAADISECEM